MKIKVDEKEYKRLLKKVDNLEKEMNYKYERVFDNWIWTRETLYKMMEDYFTHKCMTTIIKRDKEMLVGEIRKNIMDNLFKEEEK